LRERGAGGTILVRTSALEARRVGLDVEDDGPGVPEAIRSRVFDPFFTTKAAGEGTGLGLSLVYGIVTSHGGSVRLEERPGGGAAFRIELPAGMAAKASAGEASRSDPGVRGGPGRILVVDDEEPVARLICEALAEDGHQTAFSVDGREAIERLASETFDLVISDLRMPGMAVERFRDEMERVCEGLSHRLLLTTGDTMSRDAETLAEREGLGLLHKPFDLDDLRRTVRSRLIVHAHPGTCDT
jgi:two-component system NtrC family sensor kinase